MEQTIKMFFCSLANMFTKKFLLKTNTIQKKTMAPHGGPEA
jgi:hypothetical protein